ncbi:heat shock protein [Reticulomyxa filosa]|uniref:Heat shock protein n=1 Tax=Reticulomyxa filosa TaxID=46433 RepID=X6M197_RETFI|nr:heat shock protein [Reticulomyxa filosa]|eukprot:ETO07898.1 heat shock protein [Reticulomyxa filosa]
MIKEDLVNNLGKIAQNGTKQLTEIISAGADISMTGQFSVSFYSACLVSERVVVIIKQSEHNEDEQHVWKITASGTFRVCDDSDNPYQIKRETEIYLKNDCANFCKEKTVTEIVNKHSQFVVFRINLLTSKEEEEKRFCVCFLFVLDIRTYGWGGSVAAFFFFKTKKKICDLLFVPKKAPFEPTSKEKNIKLFVQRVFIMNDCKNLCNEYLSLIRCVADIDNLTLNIGRESLQQNKIVKIQKNVVNKCSKLFGEIAENKADFKVFYDQFHNKLKLEINEESKNRKHVSEMNENQKHIYYITGESRANVKVSPFLEALNKIDFEVLFLVNPINEYAVQQFREYYVKKLVYVTKGLGLPLTEEEIKVSFLKKYTSLKKIKTLRIIYEKVAYGSLMKKIKEIMGDNVEKVIVSCQIVDSSCSLATVEYGWPEDIERIVNDLLTSGLSLADLLKFACRVHKLIKLCISAFLMMKIISRMKKQQKIFKKNKHLTSPTLQQKMPTWKRGNIYAIEKIYYSLL